MVGERRKGKRGECRGWERFGGEGRGGERMKAEGRGGDKRWEREVRGADVR